jgi:hypothetical protein
MSILIFEIICSSLNVELFNNMLNKIKKQMEFKYILDHLEEQIFIYNGLDEIDFVNKNSQIVSIIKFKKTIKHYLNPHLHKLIKI